MAVRAKFYVSEYTETTTGNKIVLMPVCRGEENKEWSKWTPSGRLEMGVLNETAAKEFIVGEEYYIDFTHVAKEETPAA